MEGIQYASFGKLMFGKMKKPVIFVTLKGRLRRGREDCGREGGRDSRIVTLTGGASSSSCRTDPKFSGAIVQLGD